MARAKGSTPTNDIQVRVVEAEVIPGEPLAESDQTARIAHAGDQTASEDASLFPENRIFTELIGQEILVVMEADQLSILGQTFRPIFCGRLRDVQNGFITLDPCIVKMSNAPFFRFPTALSFVIEKIANLTPFGCDIRFPLV